MMSFGNMNPFLPDPDVIPHRGHVYSVYHFIPAQKPIPNSMLNLGCSI